MEMIVRGPDEKESLVVHLRGDCDLYSAPRLKVLMLKKIEAGVKRILFDMADLRYLDSSGVGAIICLLQAAKKAGSAESRRAAASTFIIAPIPAWDPSSCRRRSKF